MLHHSRCLCLLVGISLAWTTIATAVPAAQPPQPNIVLILADDLGYSDLGCYGSTISTPHLNRLAGRGVRFTQFYNAARCCPTRAALLTGLYPHQAGVGHMTGDMSKFGAAYGPGLNNHCATFAELLRGAGYRSYHVGKWHVGGVEGASAAPQDPARPRNHPLDRGFDRAYGTGGGGNFFAPKPLYLDRQPVAWGAGDYTTDVFTNYAVQFIQEHSREHAGQPFCMQVCYTAPHFPLQAKLTDIAQYRGKFRHGWDAERERRFACQRQMGIVLPGWTLSPRDAIAHAWDTLSATERDKWDQRMAIYAAMIDCMDQGIGRVLEALRVAGAEQNTLVLFLSDNGSSAEFLDSWPNPDRGHQPDSTVGSRESHRTLEVGWANAANTPFREHKMWAHEGGIATPLIACWPAGIRCPGTLCRDVGHVLDLLPTFLELAGASYPQTFAGRTLTPLPGRSFVPALYGGGLGPRTLAWEHEGNRALREGDWKVVAPFRGDWELYELCRDRTETNNLATKYPGKAAELSAKWQQWADNVGVVPWEKLPRSDYKPSSKYRKKSEPEVP